MSDDTYGDPLAAMDQALRSIKDMMLIARTVYEEALANGFSCGQSMSLCIAFMCEQLKMGNSDD